MSARLKTLAFALLVAIALGGCAHRGDPLPSWSDGDSKRAILSFVEDVSTEGPAFVPEAERIAVFDNDGTLWAEQPMYFQAVFAIDRIRALAEDHPEWRTREPYRSAIAGDMEGLLATGREGIMKILVAAHSDLTAEEFRATVRDWLAESRHPTTGRRLTEMIYQPMLELLEHLRARGFKTFIVTGGGIDFVRVFSEDIYGIPPEQVVGTTFDAKYEVRDGRPTIVKTGELVLLDDKGGKPVGIFRHIGRRPIFAAGNSDGDLPMLEYAALGRDDGRPAFAMLIHHTDAEREWAYDRDSHIGREDEGLRAARAHGWTVVDMKRDWETIFP